jgi:MFS family permease
MSSNPYDAGNASAPPPATQAEGPWWKHLTGYHWFVFIMASAAWVLDCLDQQIFILARNRALGSLMPESDSDTVLAYGDYSTMIFMFGWATGGLIFGSIGDRIGRARTLTITVLLYSLCTGLSAFSQGWVDFAIYRFLTGLGVGGVFGLAVALVADTLPDRSRAPALGTLQALSALGNISAGLISTYLGSLAKAEVIASTDVWKYMFLAGALPAILCVFIQLRLKEPEKWVKAKAAGLTTGVKFGSYGELFSTPHLRKHALLGMMLCVSGIIGVWGIGFFSPEIVNHVITQSKTKELMPDPTVLSEAQIADINATIGGETDKWRGINSVVQNIGAFLGMLIFTFCAERFGRKPTFVVGFLVAGIVTVIYFQTFRSIYFVPLSALMGACQLGLFAGYAIYLPELFPLRLRSTGTSFCYNVGRYVAAFALPVKASLMTALASQVDTDEAKFEAFRTATCFMCATFLIGAVVILLLPETKDKPLPE